MLILAVSSLLNPNLQAVIQGKKEPESVSPPGMQIASADEIVRDPYTEIEVRLRKEYESKLKAELSRELEKWNLEKENGQEPPTVATAFQMPQGIVSDIAVLSDGLPLKTEVLYGTGETALREYGDQDSYTATFQMKLRVPVPATTIPDIEKGTPDLKKMLPGFSTLFSLGFVSPWHEILYRNKIAEIRENSRNLNTVMSKADTYDCNTMLHLKSEKGRKVFFMQADMDAFHRGSDGDRLPIVPPAQMDSIDYDPFTSYHWKKIGDGINPMLPGWERRLAIGKKELESPSPGPDRKKWAEERIKMLETGIDAMKKRSYLISAHDPYIVLPLCMLRDAKDPYSPKVGDYAVVIHGNKIFPCIVGDRGSDSRAGEGSIRLARELNPSWKSGSKAIPVPIVSYLVFPDSREENPTFPDYRFWEKRCLELLNEIGGLGKVYELHRWMNSFPKPTAVPPEGSR